jgi:hypothetical protein
MRSARFFGFAHPLGERASWNQWNARAIVFKVWEQPLLKVAEEYGVSAVALGKTCHKLSVPVPGRGRWAKLAHDKEGTSKPPLPKLDKVPVIFRSPVAPKAISDQNNPEFATINRLLAAGALAAPSIDPSARPHPLIRHTQNMLRSRSRKREHGILLPRESNGLEVKVSEGTLERALQVMAQILAALERQGYPSNHQGVLVGMLDGLGAYLDDDEPVYVRDEFRYERLIRRQQHWKTRTMWKRRPCTLNVGRIFNCCSSH